MDALRKQSIMPPSCSPTRIVDVVTVPRTAEEIVQESVELFPFVPQERIFECDGDGPPSASKLEGARWWGRNHRSECSNGPPSTL